MKLLCGMRNGKRSFIRLFYSVIHIASFAKRKRNEP